jgi:hypothetical protein
MAESATFRNRVMVATLVADHWRRGMLDGGDREMPQRLAAHPLCCVLAALEGEADPNGLGVGPGEDAEAIRAVTADVWKQRFQPMTPIVIAAVQALCEFEQEHLLEMGYDLSYAQEDLPVVVAEAIKPWEGLP